MKPATVAVLGMLAIVTVWAVGRAMTQGATAAAAAAADYTGGLLTGNNAITAEARTTAYQGAGILGTLGAATDAVSGGTLSRAGEWLGGKIYDITH